MAAAKKGKGQIEKKYLEGLIFSTSRPEKYNHEGVEKVRHIPVTRELTEKEILDWAIVGNEVVIVAADGKKHRVKK